MCMRLSSSRQESPASTRMRVRLLATRVLFPLEPEANTVMRIIEKSIRGLMVENRAVEAEVPQAALLQRFIVGVVAG